MDITARMALLRGESPIPSEKHGVGYIRVSKVGDRGDDLISPELQQHAIETWSVNHGVRITKWIIELDESGRSFARRKVAEIVADIKASRYQYVVLWKWSRWGRNMRESQIYLGQAEEVGGIVRAATEDFDPTTTMGRFSRDQMLLVAQLQSDMLSDSWKEVHERRRRLGLPHTGMKHWGYIYENKSYRPDPDFSPILANAYERYVAGESLGKLHREWNAAGLRTTRGNLWYQSTLGSMLDTGFAAGLLREKQNTKRSGRGNLAIQSWDSWRIGSHQPIIPMSLWDGYVARRLQQAAMPPRSRVAVYSLSALLRCGWENCNSPMTIRHSNQTRRLPDGTSERVKYRNWACRAAWERKSHAPNYISHTRAEAQVLAWLVKQASPNGEITREARRAAAARQVQGEAESLDAELARLKVKRARLVDLYTDSAIDRSDYDRARHDVESLMSELSTRLATAHERRKSTGPELVRDFGSLIDEWPRLAPHNRREALSTVVSRFIVLPRGLTEADERVQPVPLWE
ncbi:DNA invertase Pin-like site-specific DNA recombinase [Catenuloplanes nepalensis]|uniref:DNA invertase Pin-like site-specific DNA recombinase n=1 Tax=Catenuloplanes nepalensis TaxID=587533 RepID=A0ABT9MMJ7_9ACTN|nr:recombinase family protein [Catenuloplanes nepalensis]MDP9792632.1 DNA invertase Pin-like site-specific DNA recombinase [Catenuloplanes nepalensis]